MPSIICSSDNQLNVGSECLAPKGCAFKYFKWTMGEGKYLVIRSLVNAATRVGSNEELTLVRSLLEFDSSRAGGSLDWRSKLDNQRGAILANEIKNNNAIIARWVFQTYLAQVDNIKLAYVSRISPRTVSVMNCWLFRTLSLTSWLPKWIWTLPTVLVFLEPFSIYLLNLRIRLLLFAILSSRFFVFTTLKIKFKLSLLPLITICLHYAQLSKWFG